jgi:hypothetical protein
VADSVLASGRYQLLNHLLPDPTAHRPFGLAESA